MMRSSAGVIFILLGCLTGTARAEPCLNVPTIPLSRIQGAPFWNCGEETGAQTPNPTRSPHAFQIDGFTVCVSPGFTPEPWMWREAYPDVVVTGSNVDILNATALPGGIQLLGNRVRWWNVLGGSINGAPTLGPNSVDVEYNGECILGETSVPEPGLGVGLAGGITGLTTAQRRTDE